MTSTRSAGKGAPGTENGRAVFEVEGGDVRATLEIRNVRKLSPEEREKIETSFDEAVFSHLGDTLQSLKLVQYVPKSIP